MPRVHQVLASLGYGDAIGHGVRGAVIPGLLDDDDRVGGPEQRRLIELPPPTLGRDGNLGVGGRALTQSFGGVVVNVAVAVDGSSSAPFAITVR